MPAEPSGLTVTLPDQANTSPSPVRAMNEYGLLLSRTVVRSVRSRSMGVNCLRKGVGRWRSEKAISPLVMVN